MIRLAVDDSQLEAKTDTTFLHTQVTEKTGDYPPNESVDSIGQRVADPNFICMIDDLAEIPTPVAYQTVAGFYVVPEGNPESPVEEARGPHVIVIWWTPRMPWTGLTVSDRDNMPNLIPVFAEACREVLRRYSGSEDCSIYGDYLGAGETPEERTASSLAMVTEWKTFWDQPDPDDSSVSLSPAGFFAELGENPSNPTQCRIIGTVRKVVEFADWLAAERRP